MKKIQRIILAFMLGIVPIQSVWADSKATELVRAAGNGNLEKVKSLLNKGVDINAKETKMGLTALMIASSAGYLNMVKYLISKGADINVKSSKAGEIALIGASLYGQLEIVKYFIDKGADINAKANDGKTALMVASRDGYLDIVKALVEGKKGLLSMFSKGADINAKSGYDEDGTKTDGGTALIVASMEGQLEVVRYLISKGANVNVVMTIEARGVIYRRTALDVAKINKHYKIAEVLKNAGAKSAKAIKK